MRKTTSMKKNHGRAKTRAGENKYKNRIPGNESIIYMHSRVGYCEIRAVTQNNNSNKNNFKNIAPNLRHLSIINNTILKFKNLQSIKYKLKSRINDLDFKPESILIQY